MSLLQLLRYKFFGGPAPPLPPITPVPAPIYPDSVLGCGQPVAEIWNRGGTQRVLALPGLTDASWGRVLADTSDATITLAGQAISNDPACCEVMRTVKPWKHELHIYRDNELQWCGPITEMTTGVDSLQLKARDLSAWLDHRLVHLTHIYGGQGVGQGSVDTTTIFSDLVTDALAPDTSPNLTLSFGVVSGVFAQGNYTPASFKLAGPLIRELAKGSVDWYVTKRVLSYTGGGVSTPGTGGGGVNVTALSVPNPGFEVNTTDWTLTGTNWTLTRDTGVFHSGVASGKATLSPTAAGTSSRLSTTLVALTVGKSYTVSIWLRAGAVQASYWAFNPSVQVSIAGVVSPNIVYPLVLNPTTWLQTSLTFIATSTTHTLRVDTKDGLYSCYADDVSLTLNNPDSSAPSTVTNAPTADFYLFDDDLAEPAQITLSGLDQENRSIVMDQQSGGDVAFYGEAPAPTWTLNTTGPGLTSNQAEFGLLEGATTAPLADSANAQSQASQRAQLLSQTPVILNSVVLSPNAGVTMDNLLPGSLVGIQLDRSCLAVRQTMLLRQVQVRTSPSGGEQVTLTLEPAGG